MSRITLLAATLVVIGMSIAAFQRSIPSDMLHAARGLISTLEPTQVDRLTIAFDSEERFNWFYTPHDRQGLPLKDMTPPQQRAALDLLRAGLSEQGYSKAETIRQLERVPFAREGRAIRDTGLYYFTIFGEPADDGVWGWRYEGHHLSQHWTIVNGTALATSRSSSAPTPPTSKMARWRARGPWPPRRTWRARSSPRCRMRSARRPS